MVKFTTDQIQDLFTLNPEQRKAFENLKKAFKKCENAGLGFYNNYGTLGCYDSAKISHYDDKEKDGIYNDCTLNLDNQLQLPCQEWADDMHYFHAVKKQNMRKAKELLFYNRPFHEAKYGSWVYDAHSNFVFQFDEVKRYDEKGEYLKGIKELRTDIINSLNSDEHLPIEALNLKVNPKSTNEILNNDELFITIRGWGTLKGIGAHNFPAEKATKIQDDFRDWIIQKLNK